MSIWSRIERRLSDLAGELLPDDIRQILVGARDLLERDLPHEARELLEPVVEQRPEHAAAQALLGAVYLELGQLEAARDAFGRALARRGDLGDALVGLGHARLLLSENDGAVQAFRAAVSAADGDRMLLALAYRGLGVAYRRQGELDKAIRELRKAVAEDQSEPVARAALGEALLVDERISAEEAKMHLEMAVATGTAPALAHLALGRIALDEGDAHSARLAFERALEVADGPAGASPGSNASGHGPGGLGGSKEAHGERLEAHLGLGDAAMQAGDIRAAHDHYLRALALSSRTAAVHARIGDVHRRVGSAQAALGSYELSLAIAPDPAVLRRALDTALEAGTTSAAVRLANDLLAIAPDEPRAMVARGLALATQGQHDAARATFAAALECGEDPEVHVALGRLELDADGGRAAGGRAAGSALAALRVDPQHQRGRALLAEARSRELGEGGEAGAAGGMDAAAEAAAVAGGVGDAASMYRVAERLGRIALARPELADLGAEAARAAADFDQPLLVTVMGEFSSGKSSFVNALIGDDVAPTGITPTTATINVVKYGRERGGRILYHDGAVTTLGWQTLFSTLQALSAEEVRRIEVVEILVPLEQLERVNIVDTPGLNSILPEHEEVARGFIARADAVLWLFTAGQAGKSSERRALERISSEGRRVLGVLNKMDQLSERDATELTSYVQGQLGELVEAVVPFSARQALAYKRAAGATHPKGGSGASEAGGGGGAVPDGNWHVLAHALEQRFFAQARQLKRAALRRRVAGVAERALAVIGGERAEVATAAAELARAADGLADAAAGFIDRVVLAERATLSRAVEELYRRAAREVLELVQPRQLPFGSHSATPADRDYLMSLLDSGYEAALEGSRRSVLAALEVEAQAAVKAAGQAAVVGAQAAGDLGRTAEDALRLVSAQVFDRARAYLRGYLRGGYVAGFFRHELPRMELSEDAVYRALTREQPDLDAEIALRLATAAAEALGGLARRLQHWAGMAEVLAYDLEVGIGRALEAIAEAASASVALS